MRYYIIAGEASGDLHGSNLIKDKMIAAAGSHGTLVRHYKEASIMGFWEVLKNLRRIGRQMRFCREDIAAWHPDVLILIDYPGFNLRLASELKRRGADSQIFQRALPSAPPDRQAEEAAAASAAQSKAVRAPPLGFSENAAPFAGASLNGLRGSQNVYHDGAFGRKGLREHVVQFRNVLNAEALSAAKP